MKLGEFAHINPSYQLKKGVNYPFVEMANLEIGYRYVFSSYAKELKGSCTKFRHRDTLFAKISPCLQNGKIAQFIAKEKNQACGSTEFVIFRGKDNISDNDFLYYLVSSDVVRLPAIKSMSGATGRQRVSVEALQNIEIEPIDITIQRKIAGILSAYDDLIETNTQRFKILEEAAQNLYKEWFVNFKFPGHENTKFIESELGRFPKNLEIIKLGMAINILKGKNITKETITEGNVPVVAGGLSPAYYHNKANAKGPIITISASGANAGYINLYYEDIWASDCSYVNTASTQYIYYYYNLLKNKNIEITRLQIGSAQPHVYPKDLMGLDIYKIPEGLINLFEIKVSPFYHLISNLKKQNQNLQKIRDLLLPRLISGELSVEDLDIKM